MTSAHSYGPRPAPLDRGRDRVVVAPLRRTRSRARGHPGERRVDPCRDWHRDAPPLGRRRQLALPKQRQRPRPARRPGDEEGGGGVAVRRGRDEVVGAVEALLVRTRVVLDPERDGLRILLADLHVRGGLCCHFSWPHFR